MIKRLFILLFLSCALLFSCTKERPTVDYQPIAGFTIKPDTGNTTTIFEFDAGESMEQSLEDNPVFIRWDWDSDGEWDKMYTSGINYTHRFFQKGTYNVTMEAYTLLGKKDTSSFTIIIPQGYSPPRASISFLPDSANVFTEFTFDASGSKDDEDSLDQLKFRWDFDGDLEWDTEFTGEAVVKHKYDDNKYYDVGLEVQDPQDMRSQLRQTLIVTRFNDNIVPSMEYECWPCTLEDTIRFDATESYMKDNPDAILKYSWDIFSDGRWELENSSSPFFNYRIPFEGIHKVKLRVLDSNGLYMDTIYEIEVFPYNTPPIVELVLANPYGNVSSEYYMHGLASWDRETSYFDRILQWDLDGDGIWEEEHNDKYEVTTHYDQPGKYPVTLRITDEQGKYTDAVDTIYVFNGDHETGILADKRGGFVPYYYGTVKIGNSWWTQNNSRYIPPQGPPPPPGSYGVDSYKGETDSITKYGYLYPYRAVTSKFSPCPEGWHIPTVEDWEQLMEDLAPRNNINDLLFGGSSELHLYLTGHYFGGSYDFKGRIVHYYTSNTTPTGHVYLWYIDNLLKKNQSVLASRSYRVPMRCVKNK